jgi:flagellar hook protein FlgE
VGGTAEATTRAQLNANLKSSQPVSAEAKAAAAYAANPLDPAAAGRYDPTTNSMAMYDPDTLTGVKPDFEMTVPVSDSKGGQRTVAVSFLKSAVPNQWYAEIRAVPASDVITGAPLTNGQLKSGLVAFTQDGRLDVDAMTALGAAALFPDVSNANITFGASNSAAPAAGQIKWADGLGIDNQNLAFNLNASAGGLTQYDSDSVVQAVVTNGTAFGNLSNIEIDETGFVTAIFDNGVTRKIAQLALATFTSPDSLSPPTATPSRSARGRAPIT